VFLFVLHAGLVAFLFLCQFAVRLPGPFPLIYMMVSSSSGLNILFLNILFGASLLLHFIVLLHIYLYHCMVGFNTIVMTSLSITTE
jgi:hypothetical protein